MDIPLTEQIRELLINHFSLEELGILCSDHFNDFHKKEFNENQSMLTNSHRLIEYCKRHGKTLELVKLLHKKRPEVFHKFITSISSSIEDTIGFLESSNQTDTLRKLKDAIRKIVYYQKLANELKNIHNLLHDLEVILRSLKMYDNIDLIKNMWSSAVTNQITKIRHFAEKELVIQAKIIITDEGITGGPDWAKDILILQTDIKVSLQQGNVQHTTNSLASMHDTCLDHMYKTDRELLDAVGQLDRLSDGLLKLVGESNETTRIL
jgi:hypothetical protein